MSVNPKTVYILVLAEYYKTTGAFNWSTRIAAFKFDSCKTQGEQNFRAPPAGDLIKRHRTRSPGWTLLRSPEERVVYEAVPSRSSEACLFAFFASALASAFGASSLIALPRLTAPVPVIFALRASKPPGISRFFATWAAARTVRYF